MDRYENVLEYKRIEDESYILIEGNEKGEERFTMFDKDTKLALYEQVAGPLEKEVLTE